MDIADEMGIYLIWCLSNSGALSKTDSINALVKYTQDISNKLKQFPFFHLLKKKKNPKRHLDLHLIYH